MAVVYKYTDLSDNIVKYVGIVWSDNRTLSQRVSEHKNDDWYIGRKWKIEYIKRNIKTRSDAELIESHYISKYHTDMFFNKRKSGWGESQFIDGEDEWILFLSEEETASVFEKYATIKKVNFSFRYDHKTMISNVILSIECTIEKTNYVLEAFSYSITEKDNCYVNSIELIAKILGYNKDIQENEDIDAYIEKNFQKLKIKAIFSEINGEIEEVILNEISWYAVQCDFCGERVVQIIPKIDILLVQYDITSTKLINCCEVLEEVPNA